MMKYAMNDTTQMILDDTSTMELSGFFSKGKLQQGIIEKNIKFYSKDEFDLYYKIFECNASEVQTYYKLLKFAGVHLPTLLQCYDEQQKCVIKQRYIVGEKLSDWIKENDINLSLDLHLNYFDYLLKYQLLSYQKFSNIRIDFNLKNFILSEQKLFLVDIMPPIFIDENKMIKAKELSQKIVQLVELYLNIDYQIVGVIGYWFLDSIENITKEEEPTRRKQTATILKKFIGHANGFLQSYNEMYPLITKERIGLNKENNYFKRLYLLWEYIDGKIDFEEMKLLFTIRLHARK